MTVLLNALQTHATRTGRMEMYHNLLFVLITNADIKNNVVHVYCEYCGRCFMQLCSLMSIMFVLHMEGASDNDCYSVISFL